MFVKGPHTSLLNTLFAGQDDQRTTFADLGSQSAGLKENWQGGLLDDLPVLLEASITTRHIMLKFKSDKITYWDEINKLYKQGYPIRKIYLYNTLDTSDFIGDNWTEVLVDARDAQVDRYRFEPHSEFSIENTLGQDFDSPDGYIHHTTFYSDELVIEFSENKIFNKIGFDFGDEITPEQEANIFDNIIVKATGVNYSGPNDPDEMIQEIADEYEKQKNIISFCRVVYDESDYADFNNTLAACTTNVTLNVDANLFNLLVRPMICAKERKTGKFTQCEPVTRDLVASAFQFPFKYRRIHGDDLNELFYFMLFAQNIKPVVLGPVSPIQDRIKNFANIIY